MEIIILLISLLIVTGLLSYLVLIIEILKEDVEGIMYELDDLDELILYLF